MTLYNVSSSTHISRTIYDIMRSMCKLVVYSHMNLVRNPRRDHMYLVYCMYVTRRDHDMISRSPTHIMRRNRSCAYLVEIVCMILVLVEMHHV